MRYTHGPLLVLAGAGSGKTRVIAHKIAHLVKSKQASPAVIAAITFTNKAAKEMLARVSALVEFGKSRPWVSTFHTLGLRILKEEYAACGLRPRFTIFDAGDSKATLADIARRELGSNVFDILTLQQRISDWKSAMLGPADLAQLTETDPIARAAFRCYPEYVRALAAYNAVDFDDLIATPARLLRSDPALLAKWQAKIHCLLIDEYQDTNQAQYELIKLLSGQRGRLTAVGDDDQSIYAWRGARPENLAILAQDFAALKIIKLEQNYRSMGIILKAANRLIAHNPHLFEKKLWSARGFGEPIRVVAATDEVSEAETVANEIQHARIVHGSALKDFAILFRSNHQARAFEA
ncbi:MAG: ATP-dependent helicase, partial [Gammaproteobacteria bacterium]